MPRAAARVYTERLPRPGKAAPMEPPPRPAPPPAPDPDPERRRGEDASASDDAPAAGDADARTVRAARLALIREQIAAGVYDTPDRLDAALDGLLADLQD